MSAITDAISELRNAQKSNRGAPAYSRFVNRPLGRIFAAVAYTMGLSPNAVTLISGAFTMTGIAVIALVEPRWWTGLVVAALLVVGYALDSADGQVARLSKRSSPEGEWLDHMMDAVKMSTIHLAVLVAWYRWFELDRPWLVVPIAFQIVASVFFFGVIMTDLIRRSAAATRTAGAGATTTAGVTPPQPMGSTSSLYSLAVIPADYGLLCLTFLTLGAHTIFRGIYTALAAVNLLIAVASGFRWFRSVKALGA
jgi:phosphatidylglycerophosphate synthase